jgi:hypothetical protein
MAAVAGSLVEVAGEAATVGVGVTAGSDVSAGAAPVVADGGCDPGAAVGRLKPDAAEHPVSVRAIKSNRVYMGEARMCGLLLL